MKLPTLHHIVNRYRQLVTIQNIGLAVAVVIALSWVWGAVSTLQKNYQHQRQVDLNNQQIALEKLQNQNFQYQQAYYKSDEFLELSARQKLGLAKPGEHLVILPSSEHITDTVVAKKVVKSRDNESNIDRWFNFFFQPR